MSQSKVHLQLLDITLGLNQSRLHPSLENEVFEQIHYHQLIGDRFPLVTESNKPNELET